MYKPCMIRVNTWDVKSQILASLQISCPSMTNMLLTAAGIPQISHLNSNHYSQPAEKKKLESQSLITGRHLKVLETVSPSPTATSLETVGHQPTLCWKPSDDQLTTGAAPPANFSLRFESKPALVKLPGERNQLIRLTSSFQGKPSDSPSPTLPKLRRPGSFQRPSYNEVSSFYVLRFLLKCCCYNSTVGQLPFLAALCTSLRSPMAHL